MKKTLRNLITIISAIVVVLGMSTSVFAADDVVLNDTGSPFIKTFDPGTKGEYKYLGYAYCFEVGPEYKYLKITYTGDPTAFDELRLEFVVNSDPSEEIKLPPCWFRKNDEGTILTVDGKEVPAPSSKKQTAIIDLAKSLKGNDISTGIRAFHIHDTPGKGTFKILDASAPGVKDSGKSASKTDASSTDDKSGSSNEVATDNAKNTATSTSGSTSAPTTGSATWPIAVACGGILVAAGAFGITRTKKFKEN